MASLVAMFPCTFGNVDFPIDKPFLVLGFKPPTKGDVCFGVHFEGCCNEKSLKEREEN